MPPLLCVCCRSFIENLTARCIKAAFDSVDRRAPWKAMRSKGVPDFLLDLIVVLREHTSTLWQEFVRSIPNHIWSEAGLYPCAALFSVAIDWIMDHMSHKPGVDVGDRRFTDLVYADDTTFFVSSSSK